MYGDAFRRWLTNSSRFDGPGTISWLPSGCTPGPKPGPPFRRSAGPLFPTLLRRCSSVSGGSPLPGASRTGVPPPPGWLMRSGVAVDCLDAAAGGRGGEGHSTDGAGAGGVRCHRACDRMHVVGTLGAVSCFLRFSAVDCCIIRAEQLPDRCVANQAR